MNNLLTQILQWMQNNRYRRASFERIIGIVPSATSYRELDLLVERNPEIFRTAMIKGGLPGLAVHDDVDIAKLLASAQEDEAPPMVVAPGAPLINKEMYDLEIDSEYYRNLGSALKAPEESSTYNTTLCVLVLRNGFVIVGKSACIHSSNFNEEIGKRLAREDAIRQIGPFLGWREADKRLDL